MPRRAVGRAAPAGAGPAPRADLAGRGRSPPRRGPRARPARRARRPGCRLSGRSATSTDLVCRRARRGTKSRDSSCTPRRRRDRVRRVCLLSVHTSPLEQPGTGDAGGMNVYVVQTALRHGPPGDRGRDLHPRHVVGARRRSWSWRRACWSATSSRGRSRGWARTTCPSQLCAFTAGVLRAEARHEPGWYDVVHSHYWLSGQVGWLARDRWGVPLVHTAHTLARVKNAALADGDPPEPMVRVIGEDQVVAEADRLVCNTDIEARELVDLYGADPARIVTIPPGVDLARFRPGDRAAARRALGDRPGRRGARLRRPDPAAQGPGRAAARRRGAAASATPRCGRGWSCSWRAGRRAAGWPSRRRCSSSPAGSGSTTSCASSRRRPRTGSPTVFRAADVVAVPSHNESFGLVALEAQACGTPVVAARVGGLPVGGGGRAVGAARRRAPGRSRGRTRWRRWRWTRPGGRRWRAGPWRTRSGSPGTGRRTRCWTPTQARRRSSPGGRRRGCARRRGCRERRRGRSRSTTRCVSTAEAAALADAGVEHQERGPASSW